MLLDPAPVTERQKSSYPLIEHFHNSFNFAGIAATATDNRDPGSLTVKKARQVLTEREAVEIFLLKASKDCGSIDFRVQDVAKRYRVSSKTIRDVWRGRTWLTATFDFWKTEDRPMPRRLGRPKGSKDTRPRKAKFQIEVAVTCDSGHEHNHKSRSP